MATKKLDIAKAQELLAEGTSGRRKTAYDQIEEVFDDLVTAMQSGLTYADLTKILRRSGLRISQNTLYRYLPEIAREKGIDLPGRPGSRKEGNRPGADAGAEAPAAQSAPAATAAKSEPVLEPEAKPEPKPASPTPPKRSALLGGREPAVEQAPAQTETLSPEKRSGSLLDRPQAAETPPAAKEDTGGGLLARARRGEVSASPKREEASGSSLDVLRTDASNL